MNKPRRKFNLLQWLESIFFTPNPERKKRRVIRQIEHRISNSRYKFYKTRTRMVDPRLGKFLAEIFTVTSQSYRLLSKARNSDSLKEICIENSLTDELRKIAANLDESHIRENLQTTDPQNYADEIENNLNTYIRGFTPSIVQTIESNYSLIIHFLDFISYDYSYIIRKFNPQFNPLESNLHFNAVPGNNIVDDLQDIIELMLLISISSGKGDFVLNVLSSYKDVEIINRKTWNRLAHSINEISQSNILVMIVQHIIGDPLWKPSMSPNAKHITSTYLNNLKIKMNKLIGEVRNFELNNAVKTLSKDIFEKIPMSSLSHYSESTNAMFDPRLRCSFRYIQAMDYLYSYYLEFFQKRLRDSIERIIVRGKWVSIDASKKLSDPFYALSDIFEKIIVFDESLDPEGDYGARIKQYLAQTNVNDVGTHGAICAVVQSVNTRASEIISETLNTIVSFGSILKLVIIDIDKQPPKNFITNWNELITLSNGPLKNQISYEYKRMYLLVQLFKKLMSE